LTTTAHHKLYQGQPTKNYPNKSAKMNINKKFDRVKQWAGEKMGQEAKTGVSEEFKSLEMEMQLRHEGKSATMSTGKII
jgi:hypothetical protein